MADRRAAHLADCRAVILARRGRAEAQEARQKAAATIAQAAARQTDDHLVAADLEWEKRLKSAFDPMAAMLLGRQVLEQASLQETAAQEEQAAADAHRDALRVWREEDAKLRSANEMLSDHRHAIYRKREDNQLAALADRISFAWSRR